MMRRIRVPTAANPRNLSSMGQAQYKDKVVGGDPQKRVKDMIIAAMGMMVMIMLFSKGGSSNNGSGIAMPTLNPNPVRDQGSSTLRPNRPIKVAPPSKEDAAKEHRAEIKDLADKERRLDVGKPKPEPKTIPKSDPIPVRLDFPHPILDQVNEERQKAVALGKYRGDPDDRWHASETIPRWLKEYFDWHRQTMNHLTKDNWNQQRYLAMTCLGEEVCGNVVHRLRPLLAMLRIAADSKRVLLIHWDAPDKLEKFLHPPAHHGINWTVPEFVMFDVRHTPFERDLGMIAQQSQEEKRLMVNSMYNDDTFGEPYYNDRLQGDEVVASQTFHDVWHILFKPTPMLHERVSESLKLIGFKTGEYAAAHIDYEDVPQTEDEKQELRLKVEHAMNCMSKVRPGGPFFVSAQTYAIAHEAVLYGKEHNAVVHAKQIAHDTSHVPRDLFTSFVEIMYMANARCVAYNKGGYGQLGYMMGYDYNCRVKYSEETECQWEDPPHPTREH